MIAPPPRALLLGKLADERRLRALAAVVLGERTVAGVAARARLTDDQAARALAHLVGLGLVRQTESGLSVEVQVLADAARAASTPRRRPTLEGATDEQATVARNFVTEDGRLKALPAREGKRRLVLAWVATRFEPGRETVSSTSTASSSACTTIRRRSAATSSTRASSSATRASTGAPVGT